MPRHAQKHYPTAWQRKTMWAAFSAVFVVVLVGIVGTSVWMAGRLLRFLQPILIPVAIAIILAYLLDPLITHLERRMSRSKAIALLFAIAGLALIALLGWIVPTISMQGTAFMRELPGYTIRARDGLVDVIYRSAQSLDTAPGEKHKTSIARGFVDWLLPSPTPASSPAEVILAPAPPNESAAEVINSPSAKISTADRQRIQNWVEHQLPNLQKQLPLVSEKFWALLKTSIGGFLGLTGFLFSLVMVPIYLFFLLKEAPDIERRWVEYLPLRPSPFKDEVATVLSQINSYIIAYFRGQLLVCLIDGILIGAALLLLGLNFAPLIGMMVVLLTMIPYIGIVVCWVPAVLIATAQWGDWWHPFLVTIVFFGLQNLEAYLLAPKIVGDSVGLHPMTVIVSIFVWGLLIGGLLGPILAVPLTATIKVLLARYVWGRRLREQVEEQIEEVPVVREAHGEEALAELRASTAR
jgi:predicted PurR-regulated permease PerM